MQNSVSIIDAATNGRPAAGGLVAAFRCIGQHTVQKTVTKVLVIEDDKMVRLMLCKVLHSRKYITFEASSGVQGLQLFREQKPDLVVTNIIMPDKEGLETIMEIRAEDPDVPIVAISGGGYLRNINFLKMAGKLGANRTIAKPFKPHDILSIMSGLGLVFSDSEATHMSRID